MTLYLDCHTFEDGHVSLLEYAVPNTSPETVMNDALTMMRQENSRTNGNCVHMINDGMIYCYDYDQTDKGPHIFMYKYNG